MTRRGGSPTLRTKFFWQDQRCFWCRTPLILVLGRKDYKTPPQNSATVDHLIGKLNTFTKGRHCKVVISCLKCNNERGRWQHKAHTEIWNNIKYDGLPIY